MQNKAMKGCKSSLKSEQCFAATNPVVLMIGKSLEIKIHVKKKKMMRQESIRELTVSSS